MLKINKITINLKLLIIILLLMFISIITINSSMLYLPKSENLVLKQLLWYLIGFVLIIMSFKIFKKFKKLSYYIYIINLILLILLLVVGNPINGSKCWFIIPKIGSFQPSEFMKISLILIISKICSDWTKNLNKNTTVEEIKLLSKILLIIIPPTIMTFLEPDTGAVIIYLIITLSILLSTPIRKRWFIIISIISLIMILLFIYIYFFQKEIFIKIFGTNLFYRIYRLLDWKKGIGMQLENSQIAVFSSGIFGHGYLKTPIYFPEPATDFIFSVFASNFGLFGSIIFIIILMILDITLINIAKKTTSTYNKYIVIGTIAMFLYQQIQNIGMTLGLLPISGITLPFISYGGSSLLSYMLIIGIIFKINSDSYKTIN